MRLTWVHLCVLTDSIHLWSSASIEVNFEHLHLLRYGISPRDSPLPPSFCCCCTTPAVFIGSIPAWAEKSYWLKRIRVSPRLRLGVEEMEWPQTSLEVVRLTYRGGDLGVTLGQKGRVWAQTD